MILSFTTLAPGGLDLRQIVSDIPRDGAAIFIYVITVISLWLVWQGSRTRDPGPSRAKPAPGAGDAGSQTVAGDSGRPGTA